MHKINYRIYHHDNEVVAVSTYAKRVVRGVAKCSPQDEFDHTKGEALAIARCNLKVAEKRYKRATAQVELYSELWDEIDKLRIGALEYRASAKDGLEAARNELSKLEANM